MRALREESVVDRSDWSGIELELGLGFWEGKLVGCGAAEYDELMEFVFSSETERTSLTKLRSNFNNFNLYPITIDKHYGAPIIFKSFQHALTVIFGGRNRDIGNFR